jgi:hypothetical protein
VRWRLLSGIGTPLIALSVAYVASGTQAQAVLWALGAAIAAGLGSELHARLHPGYAARRLGGAEGYWIGPAITALAAVLASAQLGSGASMSVPIAGGLLVGGELLAQDSELKPSADSRWIRIGYALILHVAVFVCILVLLSGHPPGAASAAGVGIACALIAAALFRGTAEPLRRRWLLAVACGIAMGQVTLALNTWMAPALFTAALLLLTFYILSGLVQALLERALDARVALEYLLVGIVGVALVFFGLHG